MNLLMCDSTVPILYSLTNSHAINPYILQRCIKFLCITDKTYYVQMNTEGCTFPSGGARAIGVPHQSLISRQAQHYNLFK